MADGREDDIAYARALGVHLQRLRQAAGLTQEEVAHRAGMSRNYYQLLEQGLSNRARESPANPTLLILLAVAGALEVDVSDVIVSRTRVPGGAVADDNCCDAARRTSTLVTNLGGVPPGSDT